MERKCSVCGSTNLEPIDNNKVIKYNECSEGGSIELKFNCYYCKECGHLEFYTNALALIAHRNALRDEANKIQKQLDEYNKPFEYHIEGKEKELAELRTKIENLAKETEADETTNKRKRELLDEIEVLKDKYRKMDNEYSDLCFKKKLEFQHEQDLERSRNGKKIEQLREQLSRVNREIRDLDKEI